MTTLISVSHQFEGFHCWPEAPVEVAFLRFPHRHMFHIKAVIEVRHDDRELEFILVKRFIADITMDENLGSKSCEMIAREILGALTEKYGFRFMEVSVFEDGENGAIVRNIG